MRDWLKEARSARGFTQQEISERLGISIAHYCMIETGKRKERMDIQLANKLAAVLDIPLGDIVKYETRR